MLDNLHFKYNGNRYAVSFSYGTKIRNYAFDGKSREAIICVIRRANTGEPFTGIAILKPRDKRDWELGQKIAAKRAIRALASGIAEEASFTFFAPDIAKDMWGELRLANLKEENPTIYNKVMEIREEKKRQSEAKRNAMMIRIKKARKSAGANQFGGLFDYIHPTHLRPLSA